MFNDEKRGAEEAYCSATTTSDMRVVMDSDRMGDAETIIAAGMSHSSIGACFLRLHGEWSCAEHPRILGAAEANRLVAGFARPELKKGEKPKTSAQMLLDHYLHEAGMLLGKLKSFRAAKGYVSSHLRERGVGGYEEKAQAVLFWWLSRVCECCGGTKWQVVEGSNRHGSRHCKTCKGSGLARLPHGEAGRMAANYIDDCTQTARTSIRNRLRRA
jgi:hypothetical protein